ncbi:hypothetical protein DAETH_11320 [Deinococcus aetherius]|uniref:Uncharacterized protein n=2 Tax=Deinococcus aetherius TaxID=200252 RepID=A0ABM8AC42_9DEIO|nr:hypothetical protein DAETH_11320 [Deinococcus aetherius]
MVALLASAVLLAGSPVRADTVPSGLYAQYEAQRDVTRGFGYHEVFEPDVYRMDEGDVETEEVTLSGGEYRFKAICDSACGDIDLVVRDSRGQVVASDYELDSVPIVSFRTGRGDYTVRLSMESCDWEPCQAVLMYMKK